MRESQVKMQNISFSLLNSSKVNISHKKIQIQIHSKTQNIKLHQQNNPPILSPTQAKTTTYYSTWKISQKTRIFLIFTRFQCRGSMRWIKKKKKTKQNYTTKLKKAHVSKKKKRQQQHNYKPLYRVNIHMPRKREKKGANTFRHLNLQNGIDMKCFKQWSSHLLHQNLATRTLPISPFLYQTLKFSRQIILHYQLLWTGMMLIYSLIENKYKILQI